MDFIQILLLASLVAFIAAIIFFVASKIWLKTHEAARYAMFGPYGFIAFILCIFVAFMILFVGIIAVTLYSRAINLPYEYEAACKTVDETMGMLMKHENVSTEGWNSVGYGLESLRLKEKIEDAIKDKNNIYAEIQGWLNNPLMPYRDLLEDNLKNIG